MADLSWTLVVNLASTNRLSTIGRRVCRHERRTSTSAETTPRREPAAQTNVCRCVFGQQNAQRRSFKKVVGTGNRRTVVTYLAQNGKNADDKPSSSLAI